MADESAYKRSSSVLISNCQVGANKEVWEKEENPRWTWLSFCGIKTTTFCVYNMYHPLFFLTHCTPQPQPSGRLFTTSRLVRGFPVSIQPMLHPTQPSLKSTGAETYNVNPTGMANTAFLHHPSSTPSLHALFPHILCWFFPVSSPPPSTYIKLKFYPVWLLLDFPSTEMAYPIGSLYLSLKPRPYSHASLKSVDWLPFSVFI